MNFRLVDASFLGRAVVAALLAVTATAADPARPLLDLMPRFAAAEAADPFPVPPAKALEPAKLADPAKPADPLPPISGMDGHSLLYVGEWCKGLMVIHGGKVIWTFGVPEKGEYEDAWMLSNGNILFARLSFLAEVTPEKKIVWRYTPPKPNEVATLQPLGLDRVAFIECGKPPKLVVMEKATNRVIASRELPFDPKQSIHPQFRRLRVTAAGTFLVAFQTLDKVVEYDQDLKEIWSYDVTFPSAVVPLANGNRLIVASRDVVVQEVTPAKQVVWSLKPDDLPAEQRHRYVQSVTRLANGNTILCTHVGRGRPPQLIEVTPDKRVVWSLCNWVDLCGSTAVQVLEEPGIPEVPGQSGH